MEIKKDLEFCRPSKISGSPPPHNIDKNNDFHEAVGHHTQGCIALKLLIEKFIKKWKLVRFLREHRNQPGNDWLQNHRDNQPRDHQLRDYQHREYQPRDPQPQDYHPWGPPWHDDRGRDNVP
jgi:hypothetical protein